MGNRDQRSAASSIVTILRRITRAAQIIPFVYLLLLGLYLLTQSILPDWSLDIADNVLNAPIVATFGLLVVGRLLKLCRWFKAACLLPVATKVESWVDSFIVTFTQGEVITINTIIGITFLIYIYLAYRHFFHVRKTNFD